MSVPSEPILKLPCGPVRVLDENGLIHARGVKYAAANRFQVPRKLEPWTEVRDCTKPATICPQNPSRLIFITSYLESGSIQDEDCLHLTVAAPKDAKNLPVMVFFHGGTYQTGGGDLDCYSPKPLARTGEVVVVTVTSRLGIFGYLSCVPDISPANLGLLDQIEALKWVQENVAVFGGDPRKVTVLGHSSGGDSVQCLLIADGIVQKNLFHRAILQSPALSQQREQGRADVNAAQAKHISCLKIKPAEMSTTELLHLQHNLLSVSAAASPTHRVYGPTFGQYPLPTMSEIPKRIVAVSKDIPIFLGYTKDEGSGAAVLDPTGKTSAETITKALFHQGADELYKEISKATGGSSSYEFTWAPKGNKWGATHCIELPFLFGEYEDWEAASMLQGPDVREAVQILGVEVKKLWIAFASGADFGGQRFVIDKNFEFSG